MKLAKTILAIILISLSVEIEVFGQNKFSNAQIKLTPLVTEQGSGIYEVKETGFKIIAIDLNSTSVLQYFGNIADSTLEESGKFIDNIPSPSFKRISYSSIIDSLSQGFLALINASFFENYERYTPLSFPIFHNNKYITSGSSPYAYVDSKHPYYSSIELYSLNIFNNHASITVFESENPMKNDRTSSLHRLVSYRYQDHPALVLGNNTETRFLLTGLLDKNKDQKFEYLLFAIGKGKIGEVAKILKDLGVKSEIMTFDGGSSVLLYNSVLGYLEKPHTFDHEGNYIQINKLPHYLYFKSK